MAKVPRKGVGRLVPSEPTKAQTVSVSMQPSESDLIESLRGRYQRRALAVRRGQPADVTKSEIVRAGLAILDGLSDEDLFDAVERLEELKEGRPRKNNVPAR